MTLDSASPTPSSTTLKAASRASSKASATPPPQAQPKKGKKATPNPPQFIGHLPVAREDALRTFRQIPENWYQYAKLGKSREAMEGSTCDCEYEEGEHAALGRDNLDHACGPRSNCINRLTQVECLEEECHCRQFCQNQRFQRKEYAPIEIVKTEKKGFGLRAEQDIQRDTFIYEYVGDVVNSPSFKKRMRDYAKEGIQHFYFMMLQKDEFIDATKSGGIGRFANHSCSPNCYVAKWTVGDRVRMGIFAKRNIKKYEELTFNYNVDRYGHQAQTCYCGEPNCVGYIGGKTQTDVAVIDDVYLEALGITDADELMELKGSKKKKGKKIDDPDFMPKMKPIKREEVPKVVQALRQVQSAKVLYKILLRLKTTEDASALREFMRLRGFSVMRMILDEFAKDMTIVAMALECMTTWPLEKRNKVEDSKITDPVKKYAEMEDETVKNVATKLLETWDKLEIAYRIPRLARDPSQKRKSDLAEVVTLPHEDPRPKRVRYNIPEDEEFVDFKATLRPPIQHTAPPPSPPKPRAPSPPPRKVSYLNLADEKKKLLERAQQLAAEQARAHEERAKADRESKERAERKQREKESRRAARKAEKAKAREERKAREREKKKHQTPEEKEAGKEKRLLKLVGEVVVKSMSKYAKGLPRDVFKKQAKELTHIIAEKEKKSSSFKEGKLDALSEEKVYKMKKFSRDYIAKVMRKYQEKEKGKASRRPAGDDAASASATPGASTSGTPGASTSSAALDTPDMEMTVEEAMDMEPDADDKDEKDESDSESESDSEDEEKDGEAEAGKPNAEGDATPDVSGNGRSGDGIPDDGKGGRMDVDEEPKSAMDVDGSERSAMPDAAPPDVVMKDGTSDGLSIPSPIGGSSTTQDPRLRSRSVTASA
uniref:Histone-lysine N-methyltransferase, H3 lysine-36 specific n=1 Tax=Schizophyllum commune (strain H4-8 / FGSC 9210) TaxID=578458 RepID=D8QG04_SCHCM